MSQTDRTFTHVSAFQPTVLRRATEHAFRVGVTGQQALRCMAFRWALRESNPRPSPCKGEKEVLVRALSRENVLPLSTAEYLGVPSACHAGVMHAAVSPAME